MFSIVRLCGISNAGIARRSHICRYAGNDMIPPSPVTTWEPQTYLRYADIRFRAGLDLIARIPKASYSKIYDLGCGTGHLTAILADRFPGSQVTGVDSSSEMLAEARREFPKISWTQ